MGEADSTGGSHGHHLSFASLALTGRSRGNSLSSARRCSHRNGSTCPNGFPGALAGKRVWRCDKTTI